MKKCKIFFSWASEYKENTKYIKKVLERVKKNLESKDIELEIQESTSKLPGFVDINNAIMQRIEKCDFFIADLSIVGEIIGEPQTGKKTPNPNVCYELGLMVGHHGLDRIFAMYNSDNISNFSVDLPFDFSHNRAIKLELKNERINDYARTISDSILIFDEEGNLNSRQPLKKHDIDVNKDISDNMEILKTKVYGDFECLEIYDKGDFDFLFDLKERMINSMNKFCDDSLERIRIELIKSLIEFLHNLAYSTSTHKGLNANIFCTKRYLIINHPELCVDTKLPFLTNGDENCKEMKPFIDEAEKYIESAKNCVQAYMSLEKRYIELTD